MAAALVCFRNSRRESRCPAMSMVFGIVMALFMEKTVSRLLWEYNMKVLCRATVLFSNAVKDQHANPNGQFEVLQPAEPVYKLLKAGGLEAEKMPELGKLVNSKLGYFI